RAPDAQIDRQGRPEPEKTHCQEISHRCLGGARVQGGRLENHQGSRWPPCPLHTPQGHFAEREERPWPLRASIAFSSASQWNRNGADVIAAKAPWPPRSP